MSATPRIVTGASGQVNTATFTFGSNNLNDLLVLFINQSATTSAPTITGWTVHATYSTYGNAGVNSQYVAYQSSPGNVGTVTPTVGSGGTILGIVGFVVPGASTNVDVIVNELSTSGSGTVKTSGSVTTTDPGSIVLAGMALANNSGTITAWTGTGPMNNLATTNIKNFGGYYVPGTTLSGATFTANWTNSRANCMLVVAFKPLPIAVLSAIEATGGSNSRWLVGDDLLVVAMGSNTSVSGFSVSDDKSNTYTQIGTATDGTALLGFTAWIAYNIATGVPNITIGGSPTSSFIIGLSGLPNSAGVDGIVWQFQSASSTPSSGSTTTTNANDYLLGFSVVMNATGVYTVGSGYTNLINQTGTRTYTGAYEQQLVSATGTYSATFGLAANVLSTLTILIPVSNTAINSTTTSTSSSTSSTSSSTSISTSTSTSISSTSSSTSTSISSTSSSTSISSTSSSTSQSSTSSSTSVTTSISTSSTSSSISTTQSTSTSQSSTSSSISTTQSTSSSTSTTTLAPPTITNLLTSGFEQDSLTNGIEVNSTSTPGALSIVTTPVNTGTYALEANTVAQTSAITYNLYSANTSAYVYMQIAIYISAYPSASARIMDVVSSSVTIQAGIKVTTGGRLQLINAASAQVGSNSAVLSLNTWYYVELSIDGTTTNGNIEGRLNTVSFASGAGTHIWEYLSC